MGKGNRGMIFFSIPYDEGWKVMVDGEPVMIYKGLDALLSFYLSDGEHTISMRYVPRGLKAGALISAFSVICMILAALWRRKADRKAAVLQEFPEEETGSGAEVTEQSTAKAEDAETEDIEAVDTETKPEENQAFQAEKGDENL